MKQIVFTENGLRFIEENLAPIADAEWNAWMELSLEEQSELIRLSAKLHGFFRAETDKLLQK